MIKRAVLLGAMLISSALLGLASTNVSSSLPSDATPVEDSSRIVVLNTDGSPTTVPSVTVEIDSFNGTIVLLVGPTSEAVQVLLNESWVRSVFPDPAFANASYEITNYGDSVWFEIPIAASNHDRLIQVSQFQPEVNHPVFSAGSQESIELERPMNVSIVEVPHIEFIQVARSNANGSWVEEQPIVHDRLGISFSDADTGGQTVALNRSWLARFGIGTAWFSYTDGSAIANTSDLSTYYLSPPHFSILYAFTANDNFYKESDQQYSDLHWDSSGRNVYVLADRRDPSGTNEMYRSWAPRTYDQTTSFTVRATWKTSQQGNWQLAVPLFFMSSSNTRVDVANSIYILYASRDSNLGYQPYYYLRYRDSAGNLRMNYAVTWATANAQVEFLIYYNSYARVLQLQFYDIHGMLDYSSYTLAAGETFSLGKIGAAAWGSADSSEPVTIGKVDNVRFDGNVARNGNFELDGNGDGVPDNWQGWIWTKGPVYRSQDRAQYGTWSVKIPDSSSTNDYGLQTVRMSTSPGEAFVGSSWVYAVSGYYSICIELWDSGATTRVAVVCKNTATSGQWEYLDVTLKAPTNAYLVDLLVYSSGSNTGTGYFDGAELRLRRSFWSVNVHDGEPALPAGLAGWEVAVDKAADMGVSYIRTDFPWVAFQPADGVWDSNAMNHWAGIRNLAASRGIDLIAVLKGPTPSWVNLNIVYDRFQKFCQGIGQAFGNVIPYYQILNEFNVDPGDVPGDHAALVSSCYSGLLAGVGIDHFSHRSKFKTIFNMFVSLGWDGINGGMRDILDHSGNSIDVVAIDYYPETNNFPNTCNDWSPLDTLLGIMHDYGLEGAITETGYANRGYAGDWRDDAHQSSWIDCALPVIYSKGNAQSLNAPNRPLLFASWYELFDHATGGSDPLQTYGLVHSDLSEKIGAANFRSRVPGFNF